MTDLSIVIIKRSKYVVNGAEMRERWCTVHGKKFKVLTLRAAAYELLLPIVAHDVYRPLAST